MGKNASLWKVKQLRAPALSRDVSQHNDIDLLGEVSVWHHHYGAMFIDL
jgi:hypothetical protein